MSLHDIGERLRQRREELGLTLRDAQAATKIRLRYLEALEAGDHGAMPGEVYAKGFLRAYGNYLGLDGWDLVQDYKAARGGATQHGQPAAAERVSPRNLRAPAAGLRLPRATRPQQRPHQRRRGRGGLLVGFTLLLLAAAAATGAYFLYMAAQTGLPVNADSAAPGATDAAEVPSEEGEDPGGTAGGEDTREAEAEEPESVPEDETEPPSEETPLVEVQVEEGTQRILYEVAADRLEVQVRFTARCWVRVVADGRVLAERTFAAGATARWEAGEAMRIRAGNPPGMDLTVNGQPLGRPSDRGPRTLIFEPDG